MNSRVLVTLNMVWALAICRPMSLDVAATTLRYSGKAERKMKAPMMLKKTWAAAACFAERFDPRTPALP